MYLIYTIFLLTAILSGCASTTEVGKGLLGISTQVLEDNRKDGISKEFSLDLVTCHNKVRDILKKTGSYIYADDLRKDMLAVYISEEDTTPVGIFLTEIGRKRTLIEVSSPSVYGKETVSKTIFTALTTGVIPVQKERKIDAGKIKI